LWLVAALLLVRVAGIGQQVHPVLVAGVSMRGRQLNSEQIRPLGEEVIEARVAGLQDGQLARRSQVSADVTRGARPARCLRSSEAINT